MTAFLPPPPSNALHLGPLTVHWYGLCIALGVLAAVSIATRRWVARGGGDSDFSTLAVWGVPAGIVGARLYHVVTDNELYRENPLRAFAIWDGGLGIWGGIAAGVATGYWVGRRRGWNGPGLLHAVAPALAVAQAVGRLGNYFNQELFGRPTTLPWALRVDPEFRPERYANVATFHPTFAYEAIGNLVLAGLLIKLDRRGVLRPGYLFVAYLAGYTFLRFFLENLRVDFAHVIFGLRINAWMSLIVFVTCAALLAVRGRHSQTA